MNLAQFLELQFNLIHVQKYSLIDLHEMMIWERNIHTDSLREYIDQENLKIKEANMIRQRR